MCHPIDGPRDQPSARRRGHRRSSAPTGRQPCGGLLKQHRGTSAEGAEFRPFSTALVDLAIDLHDGKIGCPIVGLAHRLGFHEDGLAFEFIEGGWYIVSTARFEQETGYAVRSFGGTFPGGLPILSDVSWDGTPLQRPFS